MLFFHRNKRNPSHWLVFIGVLLAFVLLLLVLWFRMVTVRTTAFEAEEEKPPRPVRVISALPEKAWRTVSFLARVQGGQTVRVRAAVGGWVVERKVERGARVRKGAPMLVLRDERVDLARREARARLDASASNLVEIERKLAQTEELFAKGIVARDSVDSLKNQVRSMESETEALRAAYRRSVWSTENLVVRADITGDIVEVLPDVGQEVLPGEVVVRMVNSSRQRIVAGVDIKWAKQIEAGRRVEVITEGPGGEPRTVEGTVTGISTDVDISSGTYHLEVRPEDDSFELWPGEIVTVRIPLERLEGVVKVPRGAVLTSDNEIFVFAYVDNTARQVPVDVIWLDDDIGAVPFDQLPEGAQVIVEGHVGLVNGEPVQIVN